MMPNSLRVLVPLCAMLLPACRAQGPSGSSFSKYAPQVVHYEAPESLCKTPQASSAQPQTTQARYDSAVDLPADELLLDMDYFEELGISFESMGAPAGLLLARLGQTLRMDIVVTGRGAEIPIFAQYNRNPEDAAELIAQIAASVGMIVLKDGDVTRVLDAHDAVAVQRALNRTARPTHPVVTQFTAHKNAAELAPALAQVLLGCQETLTYTSDPEVMILRASKARHEQLAQLLEGVKSMQESFVVPIDASRRDLYGVAEPRQRPCALSETRFSVAEYEDYPYRKGLMAMTLGTMLDGDASFIIGCGGMAPAYASLQADQTVASFLQKSDLSPIGSNVYTTPALSYAYALNQGKLEPEPTDHVLAVIKLDHTKKVAAVLSHHYAELTPTRAGDIVFLRGQSSRVNEALDFARALDAQK